MEKFLFQGKSLLPSYHMGHSFLAAAASSASGTSAHVLGAANSTMSQADLDLHRGNQESTPSSAFWKGVSVYM